MEKQVILNSKQFALTLNRLCYQLIENHDDFSDTVLIGLQPRGVQFLTRIKNELESILGHEIQCGFLDITFYRDDFRRRENPLIPSVTNIDFVIEKKKVVLIDDVLYTGRTIRSGLELCWHLVALRMWNCLFLWTGDLKENYPFKLIT
jgi:pyrimidine operon attenuation protein/uracil phosphoribosyltransferase